MGELEPEVGVSILDVLQQEQAELAAAKDTYISVIGYEKSGLAVKYGMPDSGKVLDTIARKIENETKDEYLRNYLTAVDTLINLCQGLYVKPAGTEEYVMLDPDETGSPVKFDHRMASLVGLDPENSTARVVVKKVFGDNELAVLSHSERLSRWLDNTKADLDTELWKRGN